MQHTFAQLVKLATEKHGSQAAAARAAEMQPQHLNHMLQGRRAVPIPNEYTMALAAGFDEAAAAAHVVEVIRKKTGKALAAVFIGAVATLSGFGTGGGAAYAATSGETAPMYIMLSSTLP